MASAMRYDPHMKFICGPSMFASKTRKLIDFVQWYRISEMIVQAFKPLIDNRYDLNKIASHDQQMIDAVPVRDVAGIEERLDDNTQVLAIDEVQLLDKRILDFSKEQVEAGRIVIVAGLLLDYRRKPFEYSDGRTTLDFFTIADDIILKQAICTQKKNGDFCGLPAVVTQRFEGEILANANENQKKVGGEELYAPRCGRCYIPPI